MLPGEGVPLFEIPIYLMDETDYRIKWQEKHYKHAIEFVYGDTLLAQLKSFLRSRGISKVINRHKELWKFNQIVGYIVVAVCNNDIEFNLYLPTNGDKIRDRISYNRSSMLYFERVVPSGYHFNYEQCKSEFEIKERIKEFVGWVINDYAKPPRYVDMFSFETTLDCMDLNKLMERFIVQDTNYDSKNQIKLDELVAKEFSQTLLEARLLISGGKVSFLYSDKNNNDIVMSKIFEEKCIDINKCVQEGDIIHIKGYGGIILKNFDKKGFPVIKVILGND